MKNTVLIISMLYWNSKNIILNIFFFKSIEQIDIFATNKLKANSTELFEIQQEVIK